MVSITQVHGKRALVYINASEVTPGNAWSLEVEHEVAEYSGWGDLWKNNEAGLLAWSGNISAWHDQDGQILQTAAVNDGQLPLLIYPLRTDATTYYSGSASFSFGSESSMDAVVGQSSDFTGDGALAITGFAA